MFRMFKLLGVLHIAAACASPALALPAPMADQELLDKSDLVVGVHLVERQG